MILTLEQEKFKKQFREFVDAEIEPFAGSNDKNEKIPDSIINKMGKNGYLGSMISKKYGGKGWDMVTIGVLNEEIGRGCSSVRGLLTVHGMVAIAIERWGTKEQQDYFLPLMREGNVIGAFALTEPNVGSDAKGIECKAELKDNCYILNGSKKWITMGQIADIFLVMAKLDDKPTAFLLNRSCPGLTIKPMSGLLGAKASMLAELTFDNCKIPMINLLGRIGFGLSHVALHSLDYGRYTIACGCVGIGQICIEKSIKYTRERKQFGYPLRKNQLIQKMLSEMIVQVKAARQLCFYAGALKDKNEPESIMETWIAKYFASKMSIEVASLAVQIHGANGCIQEYNIERYYRDAKINEIIEGTSQMHEILIAMNAISKIR